MNLRFPLSVYFYMKEFLLRKVKGAIEISQISQYDSIRVQDDWTRVRCSRSFLKNEIPFGGKFKEGTEAYKKLWDYFKKANLFLPRIDIPNKRVTTDVEGTSKLIRRPDERIIEIAYRRRNKSGKIECNATSPNTCYISDSWRERFFRDVKYLGTISHGKFGDRYYIPEVDPLYEFWSNFMDEEYTRLSGIEFRKFRYKTIPNRQNPEANKQVWRALIEVYSNLPTERIMDVFSDISDEGLCKLNETGEWVYDKDGFFIDDVEDFDGISEMRELVQPLTVPEISKIVGIIRRHLD